jgi:uncharacterized protein YdhG (YjbR/CyaY superfamily)
MSAVDDHLAALPPDQRAALERLRATIRAAAPDATEAISYGMPAFKQDGHGLVGYAAFKAHCSLFPMSATVLPALADALEGFTTSKGTIRFTPEQPLPDALVTRIVEARLAELAARG